MTDKTSTMPDKPLFTVIASVFNEQECLTAFYDEAASACTAVGDPFVNEVLGEKSEPLSKKSPKNER